MTPPLFSAPRIRACRQPSAKLKLLSGAMALSLNTSILMAEGRGLSFNIPPQALGSALNAYADAANVQLSYPAALTNNIKSPGISGLYTPEQALRQLLAGSLIIARTTANGTVTLEKVAQSASATTAFGQTTLPAVQVTGKAEYDLTDPYNKDYAVSNADTATKTDTPLMETPMNIQVIPKAVLNDQQAIMLSQALKNVAGVITGGDNSSGGFGSSDDITLRGFQTSVQFRNGFRIDNDFNPVGSRQLANVERIEVLKGPAAILYGRVEPGGMVNVVTKQPLATPYYALQQQIGSYDLYRTTIDATGPLTQGDALLYRVNLSYENSGSFRQLVDNERVFIAPVLKWNISPQTQATLEMEYNHDNLNKDYQVLPFLNGKFVDIPRGRNLDERSPITVDTAFVGFNWSHAFNDMWTLSQRMAAHWVDQEPSPIVDSGFAGGVTEQSGRFLLGRSAFTFDKQTADYYTTMDLTGHFDTAGLKHTLLLGGDYYRRNISSIYTDPVGTLAPIDIFNPVHDATLTSVPNPMSYFAKTDTDNYGLYLQDQIKLPYNVHVMGGFRYQDVETENKINNTSTSEDDVTPRVGLLWQARSWLSVYGNYVENFGAGNGQDFAGNQLPPQSAQQWEGGVKTEFFEGRLSATFAYFELTKQNVATADQNHPGFSIATGEVRSRGPEFDIRGEILPGWNAIATYANLDTRVTKSNNGDVGYRFFAVPQNLGSLWSTYDFQQASLRGLKIGGGVTVRDETADFSNQISTTGYTTVDLLAAYRFNVKASRVTAQLNVNNLLDENYLVNGFHRDFNSTGQVSIGTPRTFMGSLKVEF